MMNDGAVSASRSRGVRERCGRGFPGRNRVRNQAGPRILLKNRARHRIMVRKDWEERLRLVFWDHSAPRYRTGIFNWLPGIGAR